MTRIKDALGEIYTCSYIIAQQSLPAVLSVIPSIIHSDRRVNNILIGSQLMKYGVSFLCSADHAKLFTLCSRDAVSSFQKAPVESIKNLGIAALGLLMTGVGFYHMYNGITGFASLNYNDQIPTSLKNDSMHANNLHSENYNGQIPVSLKDESIQAKNLNLDVCAQKLQKAKETFLSCHEAKQLWNEVEQQGKFTLQCDPTLTTQGAVYPATREIFFRVPRAREMPMNDVLAFEMINLNNSKKILELSNDRCSMDQNDYAKQAEMFEIQTAKSFNSLIQACRTRGFWKDSIRYSSNNEKILLDQKNVGHTSTYQLTWMTKCDFKNLEPFMASLLEMHKKGVNLPPNFKAAYDLLSKNPTEYFKKVLSKAKI